jgi:hypothetical protein
VTVDSAFDTTTAVLRRSWNDTLRIDSTGSWARLTYQVANALPKDTTFVSLNHRYYRIHQATAGMQGLVRISKPRMLVKHTSLDDTVPTYTFVPSNYADYHVFETRSAARDTVAFTSRASERYCRIGIDMREVWRTALDSASRAGLQTVLAAVATVPVRRWRETDAASDGVLYAMTGDTSVPADSLFVLSTLTVDTATGVALMDLRQSANELWKSGQPAVDDICYLHVWLSNRDREWGTLELFPDGPERFKIEFFLVDPAQR